MIKKTIKYKDFNGNELTEEFYFHMNKAEATMFVAEANGDLEAYISEIIQKNDMKALVELMQKIILKSYGIKAADGKRFIKSEQLTKDFEQSIPYAELFEELMTDPEQTKIFAQGIISGNMTSKSLKVNEEA